MNPPFFQYRGGTHVNTIDINWPGVGVCVADCPIDFVSHPDPAQSYDQAEMKIQSLWAQEASDHNPVCQTQFMSHGEKTQRVIVFIHGYTNCPRQFVELGQLFYRSTAQAWVGGSDDGRTGTAHG